MKVSFNPFPAKCCLLIHFWSLYYKQYGSRSEAVWSGFILFAGMIKVVWSEFEYMQQKWPAFKFMVTVDFLVFHLFIFIFQLQIPRQCESWDAFGYMWTMDTQISLHIHTGLIRVAMVCQYSIVNFIIDLISANDGCVRYTILNTDLSIDLFVFVALRPKSTAMVIAGRSVHLTTLFPGQAWTSG